MKNIVAAFVILSSVCATAPAFATLSDVSEGRQTRTGNGSTTSFVYTFPAGAKTDIVATVTVGGIVQSAPYTVILFSDQINSPGGTVNFTTAPANGATITIQRSELLTQQTTLDPFSPFPAKTVERTFDTKTRQIQQVDRRIADLEAKETADISNTIAGGIGAAGLLAPIATGSTTAISLADRFAQTTNVKSFGAIGDCIHDDAPNIQNAVNTGAGGLIYFPPGCYRMTSTVTVTTANTKFYGLAAKIFVGFSSALPVGGILFDVTASNVEFEGLWFDSTGSVNSPIATINHYIIRFHGTSGTHLTNLKVRNCSFTNLPWNDTFGAVVTTHALYFQWADNVSVRDSYFNAPAGAATFFSGVTNCAITDNKINDTGWYSIQFNDLVSYCRISGNWITGTTNGVRVWGGSINLMSNSSTGTNCGTPGCARIHHVLIDHNYISGVHSYTAAVHIESCSYVWMNDNTIDKITLTLGSPFYPDGSPAEYIRPYVRPALAPNTVEGPNDHIDISRNLLIAGSVGAIAIFADAQDNGSGTLAYSDGLTVEGNQLQSLDTTHYFSNGISVHGQQGGWKNVSIIGNQVSGFPDGTSPNAGLIGTQANSTAPILDTTISGNQVKLIGGTPTSTTHLGIGVGGFVQRTLLSGNNVQGFWTGIRTFTNSSGTILSGANIFSGNLNADYLLSVPFLNKATVPLVAGAATVTVQNGANQCQCTDTSGTPSAVDCSVSGTTLTVNGTGTHVIAYNCN